MSGQFPSTATCSNCGGPLPVDARFCRRCGQPISQSPAGSVTESATQVFEDAARPSPQTDFGNYQQGGPIAPPNVTGAVSPAYPTQNLGKKPTNWKPLIIIAAVLLFFFLAGSVGLIVVVSRFASSHQVPKRSEATTPPIPPPSGLDAPPVPPPPPPAPALADSEFVYPGAKVNLETTNGDGKTTLELQTSDSAEKVVAWYTEKLKPVRPMKFGDTAILQSDKGKVIIAGSDEGTNIVFTES